MEHLIKWYCFPESNYRGHWEEEIHAFIWKVARLKSNNKFPKSDFLFYSMYTRGNESDFDLAYQDMCERYGEPSLDSKTTEKYVRAYFEWLSDKLSERGRVLLGEVKKYLQDSEGTIH